MVQLVFTIIISACLTDGCGIVGEASQVRNAASGGSNQLHFLSSPWSHVAGMLVSYIANSQGT